MSQHGYPQKLIAKPENPSALVALTRTQKEEKEGGAKQNRGDPQHPGRGAPGADRPRAEPARGGEPDKGRTGEGRSRVL